MKMLSQIIFLTIIVVCMKHSGGSTNFRKNYWETFDQIPRQSYARGVAKQEYRFRYRIIDEKQNMHYHAQHRSKWGVVRGCYGYTDVKGLYRIVEYTADDGGFRVKIHSQEPGIHRKNPSDVKMNVYSPLTGVGYSYVHPCVDTELTPGPEIKETSKSTEGDVEVTDPTEETETTTENIWTESTSSVDSDTYPPDEKETMTYGAPTKAYLPWIGRPLPPDFPTSNLTQMGNFSLTPTRDTAGRWGVPELSQEHVPPKSDDAENYVLNDCTCVYYVDKTKNNITADMVFVGSVLGKAQGVQIASAERDTDPPRGIPENEKLLLVDPNCGCMFKYKYMDDKYTKNANALKRTEENNLERRNKEN